MSECVTIIPNPPLGPHPTITTLRIFLPLIKVDRTRVVVDRTRIMVDRLRITLDRRLEEARFLGLLTDLPLLEAALLVRCVEARPGLFFWMC